MFHLETLGESICLNLKKKLFKQSLNIVIFLPSRAFLANVLTSVDISSKPFFSAPKTIGVISPDSVLTATDISTELYCRMKVSCQEEFTLGTFIQASAAAFMMKSLREKKVFLP